MLRSASPRRHFGKFATVAAPLALAVAASASVAGCAPALAGSSATAPKPASQPARKPNILVILMDDLGWRDVGYAGSTFYETPAIDRLAKDGLVFENAYVAYPRCTPSRYALMSGKNPARGGVPGGTGGESLPAEEFTIAEALKAGGYGTYFIGKWHLGKTADTMPEAQGFDVNVGGGSAGAVGSHFFPYDAEKGRSLGPGLEQGQQGEYLTDRLTNETIRLIERHRASKPGQPFFAYLSHYAVHTPLQAKAEYRAKYQKKLAAMGGAKADAYLARDGETKRHQDHVTYAAMVQSMDDSVATLRAALERMGIAKDTIIVFTSDHGGLSNRAAGRGRDVATSNLPLRAGKGHVYDGGTRVPMIVMWPGHTKAGSVTREFTTNTDHYATFLQLAQLSARPEQALDSASYASVLHGGKMDPERASYWYSPRPRPNQTADRAAGAIRVGKWKYVLSYDPTVPSELFDLAADPGENKDLSTANPAKAKELRGRLEAWLTQVKAVKPRLGRDRATEDKADRSEKRRARRAKQTAEEQD